MDDDLGKQRIVMGRDLVALSKSCVDADSIVGKVEVDELASRWQEIMRWVFRVNARLDRVTGHRQFARKLGERFASRYTKLPFHEIDPGNGFSYRVLDL